MVFVIVVIACAVKAQSAILRLFFAMRIFRVPIARPKPFNRGWVKETESVEVTAGFSKLAPAVELLRVLFHATVKLVPVSKVCEYWFWNCVEWEAIAVRLLVPLPEIKGLFTGVETTATEAVL